MADLKRTIEIILEGKDQASHVFSKAGDALDKSSQKFAASAEALVAADIAIAGIGAAIGAVAGDIDTANRKIQNSLGITAEDAEKFGEVAQKVYINGWSESVEEGADVVILALQNFKDASEQEIDNIVSSAAKLNKLFDADYEQSIQAAETLTKNFGISSEEAFDVIAAGFQKGLNRSGDFLESITEYSSQFKGAGADVGEFFSIMETGLGSGVLGVDKAADSFKEFTV